MAAEFDPYSKNYNEVFERAVKITGYGPDHFAAAKMKKLARLIPELGQTAFDFLDYGCGTGNVCRPFHDSFPQARYFGVDASTEMIRTARQRHSPAGTFSELDADDWKQRSYQIIFAAGVFHHVKPENRAGVLCGLRPLLMPEGRLVVWEHNPRNPVTRKIVRDCAFDRDAILLPPPDMLELFRESGFGETRILYTTFFPHWLRFLLPLESWLEWLPLGGQYLALARPSGSGQ